MTKSPSDPANQSDSMIRRIAAFLSRRGFVSLMVVASLALSAASFFNTYLGMTEYMGYPIMTALLSFGLQGIMFAMSWIIAQWLGTGRTKVIVMLGAFSMCAAVSIGFSFSALFNFIYTDEMRNQVNERYLRRFYQETVTTLEEDQSAKLKSRHDAFIISDDFRQWDANLQKILVVAQSVPQILNDRVSASAEKKEQAITRLSEDIAKARTGLSQAEGRIVSLEAQIKSFTAAITEAAAKVGRERQAVRELQTRVTILETSMAAEQQGVGSAAGEGPKFRGFKDDRDAVVRELALKEIQLAASESDLDGLEADLSAAQSSIAAAQAERAALASTLQQGEARLADSSSQTNGTSPAAAPLDPKAAMNAISDGIQRAQQGPAGLGAVIASVTQNCEDLRNEMLALPDLADQLAGAECRLASFQAQASEVATLDDRLVAYREQCNSADFATGASSTEKFANAVAKTEFCLSVSGQPVADKREGLVALLNSRGPDAHPFVVAQTALLVDKQPLSYMAVFLATAIDVLVLVAALLASVVGQSRKERALQALRVISFEPIDGQLRPVVTLDPANGLYHAIKEEATLVQFLGHGILTTTSDAAGGFEKLVLNPSAFDYIAQQIAKESGVELPAPAPAVHKSPSRSFP